MKNLKKMGCILLFCFVASYAFADNKRVAVFNPAGEGLSSDEMNWLPSSVRRRFESNFNDYTDFQLVEIQNEAEIKNLQKKAEGSSYDQSSSIKLGKLLSAEYALFSTITKAGGKYILSANVTNLSTGIRLSSVTTDAVSDYTKLFEGAGSSVNNATVKICSDLGIVLSAVDKYILLKGNNLSDDEEIRMAKKELESYNKRKEELESQLKQISVSGNLDADSKKAKLEAEKALLEQQEKIAKDRIARLEKAREQLAQDQIEQQKRSDEQRKRISEVASETERKAEELRQKKMETLAIDAQIAVIEAKKQALMEIRNNIKEQRNIIISMAQEDYQNECAKIDQEPLRKGEMDSNGNMLPEVKRRRENLKNKKKSEIEARTKKQIDELKTKTAAQENELLTAIEKDRETLKKRRTISSISDERILFVGNYAGEKYEWDATASLYISDVCIFSKKAPLSYQLLTNKPPVKASEIDNKNYDDYLDTVDLYDYMFRRKVPVISLEMDYYVESLDDTRPSEYRIVVTGARYVDTKNNKPIQVFDLGQKNFYFAVNPAVDIRTEAEKKVKLDSDKSNKTKGSESSKKTENTPSTSNSGNKTKSNSTPVIDNNSESGRFNLGVLAGFSTNSNILTQPIGVGLDAYAYLTVPLSDNMFVQGDCGLFVLPEYYFDVISGVYYDVCLGLNYKLNLGGYKPDLYATGGVGIYNWENDKSSLNFRVSAGIDFPFGSAFSINTEYVGKMIYGYGWINEWETGVSFSL